MPSNVFQEGLTLPIGLLEALPLDPGSAAYPYPGLRPTGLVEDRTVPVVILENDYLRVQIGVSLGGRVLGIYDKRFQRELLLPDALPAVPHGSRGASVPAGIELATHLGDRPNGLGFVRYQIVEAGSDEDAAGIWIEELVAGAPISFHAHWSLPPDRAELRLEWRIFNRADRGARVSPALRVSAGRVRGVLPVLDLPHGVLAVFQEGEGGDELPQELPSHAWPLPVEDEFGTSFRFGSERELWPRELEVHQIRLLPYPFGEACLPEASFGISEGELLVAVPEPRLNSRVAILTEAGETLEASVDLYPEHPFRAPLGDMRVAKVALLGPGKERLASWSPGSPAAVCNVQGLRIPAPALDPGDLGSIEAASKALPTRSIAHALRARLWLRGGEFEKARERAELAVSYNADDHLSWYLMALASRLETEADGDPGERPELLNAHYLAPLEPLLRAESFFSQPASSEKSSLVEPLAEAPDELIEVACRLLDLNRMDLATRWLDEAVRHVDLPMLRYLLAWTFLSGGTMLAEAADELAKAARLPLEAAPWREIEVMALRELAARFPADAALAAALARGETFLSRR